MAHEMFLSKPFLKQTKTNSLFCLRSCPNSSADLTDLSGAGARAGITTGATLSGPFWPAGSWKEGWVS